MRRSRRKSRRERSESQRGKVVGPGLPGGTYKPLTDREIERIHHTALDVLETVGMADPPPEMVKLALDKGCWLNEHDRLCFPRAFVEDIIANACRSFTIYARDPTFNIELGGNKVSFSTAGQAVTILDAVTKRFRPSTLLDIYDLARLVDRLDNIHRFCQPVVATDVADQHVHSMNIAYAMLAGTRKSFSCTIANPADIEQAVAMFDMALGEDGAFRKRPFCTIGACPIISPLRFGAEGTQVGITSVRLGIPCDFAIAPQAGATAPAALAGTLVQVTAETLATIILTNLLQPGHPTVYAAWPLVSDLRTGAFSGGSGEEAILAAAAVQIGNYYNLPTSVGAGMSDAKLPDNQAGIEKALTITLAGHAGANYLGEAAGMQASLMGCSYEAMVIDNDMLGAVQRTIRGIEVNDETLSFEVIKEAALGAGHFLGSEQTLTLMETEYLYPEIADRTPPSIWEENGSPDIFAKAQVRVREILSESYPTYLDPDIDEKIRERFPIILPLKAMRPGNGRWSKNG
ncbi:MAG: trimethylamine methyltransferase [Chloroflexi bacterium]|nr:trimethylamine methyltransferase [Chloroflexota bacterium]